MLNLLSYEPAVSEPDVCCADEVFLLPTSFAQQRLWFIDQLESGSPFYNISAAFQVEGKLNLVALEYAINRVVARHEVLRTIFPNVDGQPMQAVLTDTPPVQMPLIDLEFVPEEQKQECALERARAQSRCPFNLTAWPLLRVSLIRLNKQNHILVINVHHIISDGWSMGVLIREVSELYSSYERGEESGLPELEIQYADYAAWQRESLSARQESEELEYWTSHLAGLESMELATDWARPAVQSYRGGRERLELSEEVTAGLKRVSKQAGVTLFMTLLAALRIVLWRHSGQAQSVVGTPVAGRNRREVERLIGLFINTLALRAEIREERTFREQLRIERDVCIGGFANQEVPFHKVVERVQPERSLSHTPIFQVMFALQNTPTTPLKFSGLTLTQLDLDNGFTLVDLAVLLTEDDGCINGSVRYSTDLFNKDTISRLISQYVQVLSEITEGSDRPIRELGQLNDSDRRLILHQFNDTARSFPHDLSVCDLFLEQVRARPAAFALVAGDEQLTYEQLNRRANKLARYLIARGVGPEKVVGINLERSVDLIVGLLAILKAGGAYVPLDPNSPARLRQMLLDAGVQVVISHSNHGDVLRSALSADVELLLIDEHRSQIDLESDDELAKRAQAQNICYVIYTSGSTGIPKGVMIHHSSLTNLVAWHNHQYSVTDADSATLLARQGFDASVWELWPYLCAGAKLVVCDEEMSRTGAGLSQWIVRQAITISFLATPLAEAVMSDDALAASTLRYLLTGGDQLKKYAPRDVRYKLVNHYGPTESTVVTSSGEVTHQAETATRGPSIGKPINNTKVYIVDERLEPVPIGVEGELYVAGEGLARGYARRPGLTAECFVPDPFSLRSGERMYRTGDICRWTGAGEIEFIGRRDHQVKIRGYRIELGEIETTAMSVEWVDQAAVVVVETAQLGKQLVGFYVEREQQPQEQIATRDLNAELSGRLPAYMKAARWEQSDKFPLNANGKLDRRELVRQAVAVLEKARETESTKGQQTAQTAIEEIVAGIWEEVLGLAEIGIDASFFEAGGHSLLATQVVTRINEAFGVDVGVRELFESPTVREISSKIENGLRQNERKEQQPIARVRRDQPLPLSFAQERFRFLEMLQPGTPVYHMPAAVLLTGNLNVRALEESLNEVRRRHEVLRTRFGNRGNQGVQIIEPAQDERLSVCDLEQVAAEQRDQEVKRLIRQQVDTPFDLSAGRLMRTSLMKLSSIEHVLVLLMHHIISDGWSMGVLIREVSELYSSYERGEKSGLPELEIQYADYAAWQRETLSARRESEELEYWTSQLAGQESLELATDRVRPAVQSYRGGRERLELSEEVTAGLKRVSKQAGATLFMTLLAALKTLLYRYSGQEDITVGTLIAGRNRRETEKLIGLFINAVALRTDLSGGPTFSELLKRVREVTLGAYMHQDLPFERLVDHLRAERDMSRSPLFQILFLFQNAPLGTLELPGITLALLEYYSGAVGYDLMISIREQGQSLNVRLEYSKDLFNEATIKRMLKHYSVLLEAIASKPDGRICKLPLLDDVERRQLLIEWNDASCPYPVHEPFTRLIELQVENTPDAVAVRCGDTSLTYRQLNERANRLASLLLDSGVGPETTVALYARRSVAFLTALLAIFKAGGTYLPLDPEYPINRISQVIEQARCVAVLASREFSHNLRVASPVYLLEELLKRDASTANPPQRSDPNNLAYIIFTSGSTGTPKGAMIEQAGMINHLYGKITALGLSQSDVVAQTASQCFDISVWQFFACLLVGGRVEIITDEVVHDPALMLDLIEERGITVLEVVPTLLRAILEQARATSSQPQNMAALRWVIPTGEALAPDLARQWINSYPQIPLINAYGPTECSDDVTHYQIDAPPPEDLAHVPIGRPIPNMEAYILDRMLLPTPIGVPGELYARGVGVGRGYVGDAIKTAESFVPSPFGQPPGARLYKTGDLARYLGDGNIEYLGRADQQVKIRGFRIETGEVQATLCLHPEVRAAVVAARTDSTGSKHLVAYLVPDQNEMTAEEIVTALTPDLRMFLKERLPEYMVPSFFISLEAFPLTRNGKIDHKALSQMRLPDSHREQAVVAPKTSTQEHLAEIWKQVLEVNQVSIQDRFLDIGGDSMRIIRAYRALSELYPKQLTVADLFKYNTIESLGAFIDATSATQQFAVSAVQGYEL
jgi:amino acid adenylation domain-containing protein